MRDPSAVGRLVLGALLLAASLPTSRATAQAPGGKGMKKVTYDVADLIHKPGGKTGYDSVDEVVKELQRLALPGRWGAGKGAPELHERDGTKLEVTASAKDHAEVRDVLAMMRRLMDVAVHLEWKLYAVDRAEFEKKIKPKLGKDRATLDKQHACYLPDEVAARLAKKGVALNGGKVLIAQNRGATFFSWRRAFSYVTDPGDGVDEGTKKYSTAFHGARVRAGVSVSADRRFVRLKLTQEVTDLLGVGRKVVPSPTTGAPGPVEVPKLVTTPLPASLTLPDGTAALVAVPYRPAAVKAKDQVLVLALRVEIYIEEEEKARMKGP